MCVDLDWGNVAEWVTAGAAIGAVWIAAKALDSWRKELRAANRHAIAHEVAAAAVDLKYAFYEARTSLFLAGEFPSDYLTLSATKDETHEDTAKAWAHIFKNRLKHLWPYITGVARIRSKAWISLGPDVADAAEALARKARRLEGFMSHKVDMYRAGPSIAGQWPDQTYNKLTDQSIVVDPDNRTDVFSQEFEKLFDALMALLEPNLKLT